MSKLHMGVFLSIEPEKYAKNNKFIRIGNLSFVKVSRCNHHRCTRRRAMDDSSSSRRGGESGQLESGNRRLRVMATHLTLPKYQYEDEKMIWDDRIGGSSSIEVNATQAVPVHVACEPFRRTGTERTLYEWLVRDNRELRESIFEFLKVRLG